ncbi:luxr bacterial regulatory protein hth signature [Actinomyces glycerinitolerans]|uniref:Luxr bacterial regulatory protein hth signature n=2 Tax=Actinomyces glycerinitolerans TaxID=1892869 RepID=A0A1M4S0Z9_9ACTO|nr:luxr bacterial regulatory protein hth signature [Actinomyces glycerinitolerans]
MWEWSLPVTRGETDNMTASSNAALPSESTPLRVLLAEDNALVREGYADMLSDQPGIELVAAVEDGFAALRVLDLHRVDVALVDVEMPRMDGVEAAREIAARHPGVVVVMLTAFEDKARLAEALGAGAQGFLTKDMDIEQIIAAVRDAVAGKTVLGPEPLEVAAQSLRQRAAEREANAEFLDRAEALSPRHAEVLKLVARGLSNRQVATRSGHTESTVRTYLSEILQTLNCSSRTELAVKANRLGLVADDSA